MPFHDFKWTLTSVMIQSCNLSSRNSVTAREYRSSFPTARQHKVIGPCPKNDVPSASICHNHFGTAGAAHSVNRSRDASTHRVFEASRLLGHDRNRTIRSAYDRSIRYVKRRGRTKVQDKASVFGRALPGYGSSDLHAERRVSLRSRNARRSRCGITATAFHVHIASAGSRTAAGAGITHAPRI